MKIHLIENNDTEEIKKEKNKSNLKLLMNNVKYTDTDDNSISFYEIAEEENVYVPDEKYTNNFTDKIMRQILKDKYQATMYLNEWLNIKPKYGIKPEEIEEVTESYITKDWANRETDIVYKDKKYEGVFYLIEHQTKVDYKMAKRIAEYKNEIENHYEINRSKDEKTENSKRIANVTALVIYTENEEWKAKRNIKEIRIKNPRLQVDQKEDYELININNYTIEELERKVKNNEENIILKLALINKIGQIKNKETMLKEMQNIKISINQIDYIASYINERVAKKQGREVAKLMIKSIEKLEYKEGKNMLEAFVDRFLDMADEKEKKGERRGEKRGISEGISQVAINMLKQKYKKAEIKKCTGLSDERINELEKTLQSA